jgi:tryptophan 2,3-dioxygenase
MSSYDSAVTYSSYLGVDELLNLQRLASDGPEHDEMLFIIIHQTYELWFKQILHEIYFLQTNLEGGDTYKCLATLSRIRTILKVCVAQVDILETMTPRQFNSFRQFLASSSGFQSAQFREFEAILGRRDSRMAGHLPPESQEKIAKITAGRSLWDSTLVYLSKRNYEIPRHYLSRDFSEGYEPNKEVQDILLEVHLNDPETATLCERLVDIDEGLQEWRYRHVKMVERTIGRKSGTGGSAGVDYLKTTLSHPVFGDLWAIRDRL